MASWLFPDPPRDFPARRWVRISIRTAHILATGILLGGHLFEVPAEVLRPWTGAAIGTGVALLATDLHATMAIAFQVRGALMFVKLALVWLVAFVPEGAVVLLTVAGVIGGIGSHMPSRWRYRVLLFEGVVGDERKG